MGSGAPPVLLENAISMCCWRGKQALSAGIVIALVLFVLGFGQFFPIPNSTYPVTFVDGEPGKPTFYCAMNSNCTKACMCGSSPCNFDHLEDKHTINGIVNFIPHLLGFLLQIFAFSVVTGDKLPMIKMYANGIYAYMVLAILAAIVGGAISGSGGDGIKFLRAWLLYRTTYENEGDARCFDYWFDDLDKNLLVGFIVGVVFGILWFLFLGNNARIAKRYVLLKSSLPSVPTSTSTSYPSSSFA